MIQVSKVKEVIRELNQIYYQKEINNDDNNNNNSSKGHDSSYNIHSAKMTV